MVSIDAGAEAEGCSPLRSHGGLDQMTFEVTSPCWSFPGSVTGTEFYTFSKNFLLPSFPVAGAGLGTVSSVPNGPALRGSGVKLWGEPTASRTYVMGQA